MSKAPHMATERRHCQITGKQVHPAEGFAFGTDGCVFYSLDGYAQHLEGLHLLNTGTPPDGCHECGRPASESLTPEGKNALYLHMKDGLYQVLCRACSDRYEVLVKDRYRDTPYGAQRKL